MPELFGLDAYAPDQVAARVSDVGVRKARLPFTSLAPLGVLAGAFIGLGALMFAFVVSDSSLSFASGRLLGGLMFSLGLILVNVAGAELFTGNNLLVMAWAERRIDTSEVLRNWAVAGGGNFVGAAGLALMVWLAGTSDMNHGEIGRMLVQIAVAKVQLPASEAFFRAVLCNVLVCMAVWMGMAGRSVADKVLAIVFPVTAFVAAGFEHCIANMFFLPLAMLLGAPIDARSAIASQLPVIAGNLVGGSVLVALVYWTIYLRARHAEGPGSGQ
jgi:formate transporter